MLFLLKYLETTQLLIQGVFVLEGIFQKLYQQRVNLSVAAMVVWAQLWYFSVVFLKNWVKCISWKFHKGFLNQSLMHLYNFRQYGTGLQSQMKCQVCHQPVTHIPETLCLQIYSLYLLISMVFFPMYSNISICLLNSVNHNWRHQLWLWCHNFCRAENTLTVISVTSIASRAKIISSKYVFVNKTGIVESMTRSIFVSQPRFARARRSRFICSSCSLFQTSIPSSREDCNHVPASFARWNPKIPSNQSYFTMHIYS